MKYEFTNYSPMIFWKIISELYRYELIKFLEKETAVYFNLFFIFLIGISAITGYGKFVHKT